MKNHLKVTFSVSLKEGAALARDAKVQGITVDELCRRRSLQLMSEDEAAWHLQQTLEKMRAEGKPIPPELEDMLGE